MEEPILRQSGSLSFTRFDGCRDARPIVTSLNPFYPPSTSNIQFYKCHAYIACSFFIHLLDDLPENTSEHPQNKKI